MSRQLAGRSILITGASSGIGAATAIACAREGMNLLLAARRAARLAEVAAACQAAGAEAGRRSGEVVSAKNSRGTSGGGVVTVGCDIDREADVAALFGRADESFGRLDAVLANAGWGVYGPIETIEESLARAMFETNVFATLRCMREAMARFRRQGGGHLLVTVSVLSETALPRHGIYSATKAAQDAIAAALRAEAAAAGIHVSTIHPIGTRTEFFDAAHRATSSGQTAPGPSDEGGRKPHSPEKVARAIVRCLRRPRPEVWPSPLSRFGVAAMTAFPRLAGWVLRRAEAQRQSGRNAAVPRSQP